LNANEAAVFDWDTTRSFLSFLSVLCGLRVFSGRDLERGNQNLGLGLLLPIAATQETTVAELFTGIA